MFDKFCIGPMFIYLFSLRFFKLFQRQSGWSCLFRNLLLPMDFTSYMQCFASDSCWWPLWILVLLWSSRPRCNGVSTIVRPTCNSFDRWPQPKHPTLSAFGRASSFSLGSIAFGSLIVTLLDLLRLILNAAQNNANADGHREFHYPGPCGINIKMWPLSC
jgi:hypothetical protein